MAPDTNQPPVLTFAVGVRAVPRSSDVILSVSATDPDNDPVTVTWQVTRNGQPSGTLNAAQQGETSITWVTPQQTGRDTVTMTGTDGKGGTTTLVETIQVGTLKRDRIQLQNVTWSVADSPFIIRPIEDKFVIDDAKLTVDAGCELLIDRAALEVSVVGTLQTNGTAQTPVKILPNARVVQPGFWQGITANPGGLSTSVINLTGTQVSYATEAIKANEVARAYLNGCQILFSSVAAVLHQSYGELRVENSAITNNLRSGIRIKRLPGSTQAGIVVISGDSIATNGDISGATPYPSDAGIYIEIPDSSAEWSIDISDNEISRNGFPGIQLVNASYPNIHYNSIFANELGKISQRYNIKLDNDFGGFLSTINAQENFWGLPFPNAADSTEIKKWIRDADDSGTIKVHVIVTPWRQTKP